jgi:hypothetical protein
VLAHLNDAGESIMTGRSAGNRILRSFIFLISILIAVPVLTGCQQVHCSSCNFSQSLSNSPTGFGAFLWGAVQPAQLNSGQQTQVIATVVGDAIYNGQIAVSVLDPDIKALDPNNTITFSVNPQFVQLQPKEAFNVTITITTTAASPKINSFFYVDGADVAHASSAPYSATVSVPLIIQ